MALRDNLGDRMKSYEGISDIRLVDRTPVIIRLDGKAFHTLTKKLNKPYDAVFSRTMTETMEHLVKEVQNCVFGYTQSDEISLLLIEPTEFSDSWFGNRVQKLVSISASIATAFFRNTLKLVAMGYDIMEYEKYRDLIEGVLFDARAFNLPPHEVSNYFIWRQQDCHRNAVSGAGQASFTQRELNGMGSTEIVMMLAEKGIKFNEDFPDEFRWGKIALRTEDGGVGREPIFQFKENRWRIDALIPRYGEIPV